MPKEQRSNPTPRVATSDDLEVSAYPQIAREKSGQGALPEATAGVRREAVVVIDFGSQYSRLIARRIRESKVYCEIIPHDAPWEAVASMDLKGIVLSGGPASVYEPGAPLAPSWVYHSRVPVLGICYGMQVMVHQLGGKVSPSPRSEYGHAVLHQNAADAPIFNGLPPSMPVWMSHGDQIVEAPPGFSTLAYTDNSPIAITGNESGMLGIQFHPEVAHTPQGAAFLQNFLYRICQCQPSWTPGNFVDEAVAAIQAQVVTDVCHVPIRPVMQVVRRSNAPPEPERICL